MDVDGGGYVRSESSDDGPVLAGANAFRCGCVWLGLRCPNEATEEDGLCNWCAGGGARSEEQLRADPAAVISPDGVLLGLGGAGQLHDAPLADLRQSTGPKACWYENSGRDIRGDAP